MPCAHCGALRRVDGGVRIGGRVSLTVLPPCPCGALPRLLDDSEQTFGPWDVPILIPTAASVEVPLRLCVPADGNYSIGIIDVTFDDDLPDGATIAASLSIQSYAVGVCEWEAWRGWLAVGVWNPPADPLNGLLVVNGFTGRQFIVLALVTVISLDGFTVPPVARLRTAIDFML